MKTRINENTVRFRLTKPDLEKLRNGHSVMNKLPFQVQDFTIELKPTASLKTAEMKEASIVFSIPLEQFTALHQSNEEGFKQSFDCSDGRILMVIVEKDYKCEGRKVSNEQDFFSRPETNPNPC